MKIKKIELIHLRLPMRYSFKTGFGTIKDRETLIIKTTTVDGIIGYGESAALSEPLYLSETIETCKHIIRDCIIRRIAKKELDIDAYVQLVSDIRDHNIAKYGVECSLWMIKSLQLNKSISELIGGNRTEIEIGESVGMLPTISATLDLIGKRIEQGYKRIKIKIEPGWDLELLKVVRKTYPYVTLMVDANSSYALVDIKKLQQLDSFNLMMIEQPLGYNDLLDHAKLQKKITTPICLDESITSYDQARYAIQLDACKIINVKPGRVGGLSQVIRINDLARKTKIPLWCGGMLESDIGKAYNLAAASLSEFSLPADSTESGQLFTEDLTVEGIHIQNGIIKVSKEPGLGYTINEKIVNKYTINHEEILL